MDTVKTEKISILCNKQYGSRRGLNTQYILILLSHHWHTAPGKRGETRVIAVDVAGAFDKVSHPVVLNIASYLTLYLAQELSSHMAQYTVPRPGTTVQGQ